MKSSLVMLLCVCAALSSAFRHRKNRAHKSRRQEFNDDDRKLINILEKISIGKKDKDTAGVQTIIRKNEHFQSMEDMHALDFEKLAEVRQGYGLRLIKDKTFEEQKRTGMVKNLVLTLEPVFMVLNPQTLSFYMNENINSLMDSFPLKDLEAKIITPSDATVQANHYMTCFQLVVSKVDGDIICLESRFAVKNWIDAIHAFYKSTLRLPAPGEDIAIMEKGSTTQASSDSNQFAALRIKSQEEKERQEELAEKNLQSIIQNQNLKRNSFLQSAIQGYKSKMEEYKRAQLLMEAGQLKSEKETEEATEQLDCMNDQEAQDQQKGIQQIISKSMDESNDKEDKLQKELMDQLAEISEKTKVNVGKLEESRQESQNRETKMIQNFGIAQVQQAYAGQIALCYDADLGLDTTRENYINEHCKKIVASKTSDILKGQTMQLLSECMETEHYCEFCCDYEVGVVQVARKNECLDKCANALKNIIPPEITVKLNLSSKTEEQQIEAGKKEFKEPKSFRFKQNLKHRAKSHRL